MSVTKNVFRLNKVYDLIVNGEWVQYNNSNDPGQLWAWGQPGISSDQAALLGENVVVHRSSPVQIPGTQWNDVKANTKQSLARKADGTLWIWGSNCRGALGINDVIHRSSPVQIPGTQWNDISGNHTGGVFSNFARKTDGTLWAWGDNYSGRLGISAPPNNYGSRSSPVQIPGTQWNAISGGNNHTVARKTDGTLWAWGTNGQGQLGNNTDPNTSSPIQVPGTQWSDVSAGSQTLARKTDGTLWVWGCNYAGQLGNNARIDISSPIQIPGTQWNDVSAGGYTSMARKTDGTVWTWGIGTSGQLGDNSNISKSSPVQVTGSQWNAISAGQSHMFARKTDGTLWGWGQNYNPAGTLGDNTRISKSAPIQVPGTQWNQFSSGNSHTLAIKLI